MSKTSSAQSKATLMIPGSLVSDDDFEITSCVARPNLCGVLAGSAPLEFCNLVRCPPEVAGCLKTQVYDRVLTPGGRYCNCLKTCVERINPPNKVLASSFDSFSFLSALVMRYCRSPNNYHLGKYCSDFFMA